MEPNQQAGGHELNEISASAGPYLTFFFLIEFQINECQLNWQKESNRPNQSV
jgi:hypothetical protein